MNLTDRFLSSLAAGGVSPSTVSAYRSDLVLLRAECPTLTPATLGDWLSYRKGLDAPATVSRRLAAVRKFCAWLVTEGRLKRNPAAGLTVPRPPRPKPEPLDLAPLLRAAMRTRTPDRDRALVLLLGRAGLTVSEAVALDRGSYDRGKVVVPVAANRVAALQDFYRDVPLDPETDAAVRLLIAETVGPLLANHRGRRLTRQGAFLAVQSLAQKAGLRGVSPARLRSAAAVSLLASGMSPMRAARQLGIVGYLHFRQRFAGRAA